MSGYNQQSSYPNSAVHHNQSTMESEAHKQYMASMRRRAPPPRFRPPMIIFMVLMGGLVFIGLVMTIIAVWPGYTPVGGNPLKIAGPILLGLGGIGFIIGIVLICRKSQDEKKEFARSFYAASQRSLARSQATATPTPSMDAKPGKGILKNPSSSSYNGTVAEVSDSGMPAHSFSTNRSYEGSEGSGSITGQGHVVGRVPPVSLNPDPTAAYRGHQKYPGGPVDHSSSTESEQAVMAHMTQMARAPQKQQLHSSSYQNQAYAKETDIDGDIEGPRATSTGKREMQQYGNNSFDAYDPSAHVKQQQQHKQLQLPKQNPRWGQNREKPPITPPAQKRGTTPPPLRSSGVFNEGYEVDNQISTVSQQYTQYTTPQRQVVQKRQTYQYTPATASPGYTPATASPTGGINTSSVSTEV